MSMERTLDMALGVAVASVVAGAGAKGLGMDTVADVGLGVSLAELAVAVWALWRLVRAAL